MAPPHISTTRSAPRIAVPEEREQSLERESLDVAQRAASPARPAWRGRAGGRAGARARRRRASDALRRARRAAIRPRLRLLELRGDADQQVLAVVGRDELDADRQAVGGPVQRQRDRRLAGGVEGQGEGGERGGPEPRGRAGRAARAGSGRAAAAARAGSGVSRRSKPLSHHAATPPRVAVQPVDRSRGAAAPGRRVRASASAQLSGSTSSAVMRPAGVGRELCRASTPCWSRTWWRSGGRPRDRRARRERRRRRGARATPAALRVALDRRGHRVRMRDAEAARRARCERRCGAGPARRPTSSRYGRAGGGAE